MLSSHRTRDGGCTPFMNPTTNARVYHDGLALLGPRALEQDVARRPHTSVCVRPLSLELSLSEPNSNRKVKPAFG